MQFGAVAKPLAKFIVAFTTPAVAVNSPERSVEPTRMLVQPVLHVGAEPEPCRWPPTVFSDEVTTADASVVPVNVPAAAVTVHEPARAHDVVLMVIVELVSAIDGAPATPSPFVTVMPVPLAMVRKA
jgi:hypothetical protein